MLERGFMQDEKLKSVVLNVINPQQVFIRPCAWSSLHWRQEFFYLFIYFQFLLALHNTEYNVYNQVNFTYTTYNNYNIYHTYNAKNTFFLDTNFIDNE